MKRLVFLMLSVVLVTSCYAQRNNRRDRNAQQDSNEQAQAVEAQPADQNVISQECIMNISLFNESARNQQFADALGPWTKAFEECPGANRVIYAQGRNIIHWELSQQTEDAAYQKVFEKLMFMYEQRIKYFGNDERYPTPWIKGIKALDFLVYSKSDEIRKPYEWLEIAVDGLGEKADIEFVRQFIVLSDRLYTADNAHTEKYIADYLKAGALFDAMIEHNPGTETANLASQYKNGIDVLFAQSGAANCETLDLLYADRVKERKTDLNYLTRVISFYRRVRCTESEVYFSAAVDAYKIQPDAESAAALGAMSFSKGEFQEAIKYYTSAIELTENTTDKGDYNIRIAQIYFSRLSDYPRTKTFAQRSLEFTPNNGSAYLLIGLAYASARNVFEDPILQKTVYWAAVDKFVRAKQVDPTLATIADEYIATYSKHFPSNEDIFMHPNMSRGQSYFVGSWINETTTAR
jgi:tetratricopeptide (TPR) repeat protein